MVESCPRATSALIDAIDGSPETSGGAGRRDTRAFMIGGMTARGVLTGRQEEPQSG